MMLAMQTWRALFAPRRLVPIFLVATPMIVAESGFGRAHTALAVCFVVGFVLSGPWLWRLCQRWIKHRLLSTTLFAILCAIVVLGLGLSVPLGLGLGRSFLTTPFSLLIGWALFSVGGWGLGRDIEMEQELSALTQRAQHLERLAQTAQLMAIRSHLDPHFLFNTLNAIAEWCRQDPIVAEEAILRLSKMLRAILGSLSQERWSLSEEVSLICDLLALYAVRDAERYQAKVTLEPELEDALIPPMLLLPLVENAIKHGPSAGHSGVIRVEITAQGDEVCALISNPGRFNGLREQGQGVKMVERRLAISYDTRHGQRSSLSLTDHDLSTTALCRFPLELERKVMS